MIPLNVRNELAKVIDKHGKQSRMMMYKRLNTDNLVQVDACTWMLTHTKNNPNDTNDPRPSYDELIKEVLS